MNKKFFLFCWWLLIFFLSCSDGVAQEGAIDLTKIEFGQPGLHPISGHWEFYWNRLLSPADFDRENHRGELMKVPGAWNRQSNYPALGYATYRTIVKLPPHSSGLSIYFPTINSSAKIWINGELVGETGNANADESLYKAKLTGTVVDVPPGKTQLEVIVQVVNYTYFVGGFSGIPRIGKITHLLSSLNRAQGIDNFFAGSLIAMFIYQLVLFSLYHRGKPYLWLALICLGVALRAMIVHGGSLLLPNLFPAISWELWKKIEFGSVYAMTALFPLYIYHLFQKDAVRWALQLFVVISVLLCLLVIATPQYIYGQLLEVDHLALLLAFFYAMYTVGKAWKNGNKDAKIIFFGVLVSFPFILAEMLKNSLLYPHTIQVMYLVELGVLVFLLFQMYLLANHYAHSYKDLESLNENLEEMVVERTGQLVTANRVRDRLLSVVSHDIKGPLNSLRGMLNIYSNGSIDAEEFKHFSKRIDGDLSKTSLLVDNILYWTSSQLKGAQVKYEKFDLRCLLKENIDLFHTIASNKKLSIKNEQMESHVINFDRHILNLTIRNLISNAIKFSHEGQNIIIQCEQKEEVCLVRVVDFGIGMNEEVLISLQRAETTMSGAGTHNERGSGLGLSFCREYLQLAGGELEIKSAPGKGSTMTISIPQKFPVRDRLFLNII